jgi:hypothetical protein
MTATTETPATVRIPTVEDRLDSARNALALLTLFCEALTTCDRSIRNDHAIEEWGWYRAAELCEEGYGHITAAIAAIEYDAARTPAPDAELQ